MPEISGQMSTRISDAPSEHQSVCGKIPNVRPTDVHYLHQRGGRILRLCTPEGQALFLFLLYFTGKDKKGLAI